jgi:hypothetical protein
MHLRCSILFIIQEVSDNALEASLYAPWMEFNLSKAKQETGKMPIFSRPDQDIPWVKEMQHYVHGHRTLSLCNPFYGFL